MSWDQGVEGSADHENGTSTVEATAVGVLPDVFDLVGVPADEAAGKVGVCPLDCFVVTFKRALTPANDTTGSVDADEYPAWREAEDLAADDEQ